MPDRQLGHRSPDGAPAGSRPRGADAVRGRHPTWFLVAVAAVVVVGLGLRLTGLAWDELVGLHPDERHGAMVVREMGLPGDPPRAPSAAAAARAGEDGLFATAGSALNPRNTGREWVWGDLPPMLGAVALGGPGAHGFPGDLARLRLLAACADGLTLVLVILLGLHAGAGRIGAVLAGALYAVTPLAIQYAHFFVVDTFAAVAVTAALVAACARLRTGSTLAAVAGGAAVGLAVACKVTMAAVAVPVAAAALASPWLRRGTPSMGARWLRGIAAAAAAGVTSLAVFRLVHPYAFTGPGVLDVGIDPRWWHGLLGAARQQRAGFDAPWSWQWIGASSADLLSTLVRWGVGPALALAAVAGIGWAAWRGLHRREWAPLVPAGWTVLVLTAVAAQPVKAMRYVLPAVPAIAVLAGAALAVLVSSPKRRWKLGGLAAAAVVVVGTAGSGVAVTAMHVGEHPRNAASRWIREHVPPGAAIATESAYDDAVPGVVLHEGGYRDSFAEGRYRRLDLALHAPDSPGKLDRMVRVLAEADWLVISSDRLRRPISRLSDRFPMTSRYYSELLSGRLGFEPVATFEVRPRWLGLLPMNDSAALEEWIVYDHPTVRLFRRTDEFHPDRTRALLRPTLSPR